MNLRPPGPQPAPALPEQRSLRVPSRVSSVTTAPAVCKAPDAYNCRRPAIGQVTFMALDCGGSADAALAVGGAGAKRFGAAPAWP